MMRVVRNFLREHKSFIIILAGVDVIFTVVFTVFEVPVAVAGYAFLLAVLWTIIIGICDFIKYFHHQKQLEERKEQILIEAEEFPEAESVMEEQYQELLRRLYQEKAEFESYARMREMENSDYYGMWVHQIKNPIAALKVLLQNLEMQSQNTESVMEDDATFQEIRSMKMEVFKIEQYVEMALTYLRVGDMSADFSFGEHSLDAIVRQAVHKYSQMFILTKTRLVFEPIEECVITDEKWLEFVIEQILSNAVKYARGGTITIYTREHRLVIADDGIGIAAEDIPRIFEKGFTGYNGREDKKSTGIGLYLCKTIMNRLKHRIWIESEEGKGTRVYLDFFREERRVE